MTAKADTTAIVAISRHGAALATHICGAIAGEGETALYVERRFAAAAGDTAIPFDLPARPVVERLFREYGRLVLLMPVGAAVRLLARHIGDKHTDPAVVCIDDAGRFVVSLLSGHAGGADALAARIANAIDAAPVITSASHVLGTLAVDMLGSEHGWRIEASSTAVTRASAAIVNGEPVGVHQDAGERDWWDEDKPLPPNVTVCDTLDALARFSTALLISDRVDTTDRAAALVDGTLITYRPRSLAVGIGCRRGVELAELETLLRDTLAAHRLAVASVRCIATAELKRDEAAIALLAERMGVPVRCYGAAALNASPGPSPASASQRLLGIVGVAEPAALLASGGGIIVPKVKSASATLAVARIPTHSPVIPAKGGIQRLRQA